MRQLIVVIVMAGLLGCVPKSGSMPPEGPQVSDLERASIVKSALEAEAIFVGRLTWVDAGVYAPAGAIATNRAKLKFRLLRTLKGELVEKEVEVLLVVFGDKPYFRESSSIAGRYQLSESFFRKGYDYVVFAKKLKLWTSEESKYHVVGEPGSGIWIASRENLTELEKVITPRQQ